MKAKFTEIQKFTQWWIWKIVLSLLALPVYAFLSGEFSMGLNTGPIMLVVILLYLLKLKIRVDYNGVNMVYFPFVNKFTECSEIRSVSVIDYGFVGGWGIRFWTKYGTVYNVRGNKGMLIELSSGKMFVIGTQNEVELKSVLKDLGKIE